VVAIKNKGKRKMTVKELLKQYPKMETLALIDAGGSPFPSWSYSPDDDVIEWHIEKNKKSIDITDALFNQGKPKVEYKDILVFTWRRKGKK
jgi:hypothetical protein